MIALWLVATEDHTVRAEGDSAETPSAEAPSRRVIEEIVVGQFRWSF